MESQCAGAFEQNVVGLVWL